MLRQNSGAGYHEDAPVAVSVDAPQLEVGLGFDGGGPGGPVDQGQFSETAAFPDAGHPLPVHVHLRGGKGETKVMDGGGGLSAARVINVCEECRVAALRSGGFSFFATS